MPLDKVEKIWMDGDLVNWDDANVHILTHTLHYGSGVFEGIRAYPTSRGPAVFRLTDHMRRLPDSPAPMMMELPVPVEEPVEAAQGTIRGTRVRPRHNRPVAYL